MIHKIIYTIITLFLITLFSCNKEETEPQKKIVSQKTHCDSIQEPQLNNYKAKYIFENVNDTNYISNHHFNYENSFVNNYSITILRKTVNLDKLDYYYTYPHHEDYNKYGIAIFPKKKFDSNTTFKISVQRTHSFCNNLKNDTLRITTNFK